jgi:peptidoglycan/LPS O-acetylase OafA/YrhL
MPANSASQPDAEISPPHGGRAGWFRIACGFSALATVGISYQAWSIVHPSATTIATYSPSLAVPLILGAVLLAVASFLAIRHRRSAGLFLLLGYLLPALALYLLQGIVVPPSLLLVASMISLILATRRSARPPSRARAVVREEPKMR